MSVVRPLLISSRGVLETIIQLVVERLNGNPIVTSNTVQARNLVAESAVRSNDIKVGTVDVGTLSQFAVNYVASYEPLLFGSLTSADATCNAARIMFGDDPNPADNVASLVWPKSGAPNWNVAAIDEQRLQFGGTSPFISNTLVIPSTGIYRVHLCLRGAPGAHNSSNTALAVHIGGVPRAWTVSDRMNSSIWSTALTYNLNFIAHCTINDTVQIRAHCPRTASMIIHSHFFVVQGFDFSMERIGNEFASTG